MTELSQFQSSHPYENSCTDFWIYRQSGAGSITITFSAESEMEDGFDYLYIYDGSSNLIGEYTGTELANQSITIPGDTVKVQIDSDDSGNAWGFRVTDVDYTDHTHSFANYVSDGNATCTEDGTKTAKHSVRNRCHYKRESRKSSNAVRAVVMRFNDFLLGKPYVMQHSSHCEPALSGEFDQYLSAYLSHCRESGNKETTIRRKRGLLVPFLHQCQKFEFEEIRPVNASIIGRVSMLVENKEVFAVIRDFLRFLCAEGIVPHDLSVIVPRYKRAFKILKYYAKLDIEQLHKCAIPVSPPTGAFQTFLEGGLNK